MTASATFRALGCAVEIVVDDDRALPEAQRLVHDRLSAIDAACSRFRADSELVRLSAPEHAGRPVRVSPLLADALDVALSAARWTDGVVDPTMGAELAEQGYDTDHAEVAARAGGGVSAVLVRRRATWRDIAWDRRTRTVSVPDGVRLDLGATAKAWAADTCADLLHEHLSTACLVSIGGDVAVRGERPGGWVIAIRDTAADPIQQVVTVATDGGLATSGTRARRWRRGGDELHHILDPFTGQPARSAFRTVSVWAPTCVEANVLSTAAIAAPLDGPDLLRRSGRSARLVATDGAVVRMNAWPQEVAA